MNPTKNRLPRLFSHQGFLCFIFVLFLLKPFYSPAHSQTHVQPLSLSLTVGWMLTRYSPTLTLSRQEQRKVLPLLRLPTSCTRFFSLLGWLSRWPQSLSSSGSWEQGGGWRVSPRQQNDDLHLICYWLTQPFCTGNQCYTIFTFKLYTGKLSAGKVYSLIPRLVKVAWEWGYTSTGSCIVYGAHEARDISNA